MKGLTCVLEGPDGGSKTTLARTLQARYGSGYQHAGPPFEGATPASLARYYAAMLTGIALGAEPTQLPGGEFRVVSQPCIIDRWALGETVYGPLFRGRSLIGMSEWRALAGLLDATSTPLVVCLPPRDVCMKNWQDRVEKETFKDRQRVLQAYEAYASWAYGGQPHLARPRWVWIYDYTRPAEADFFGFLDAMAEKQS